MQQKCKTLNNTQTKKSQRDKKQAREEKDWKNKNLNALLQRRISFIRERITRNLAKKRRRKNQPSEWLTIIS